MSDPPTTELHQVNSGIEDVLSGYETLKERAEAEIMDVARELDTLHRKHAAEIGARLVAYGEGTDDGSIRGTVNQAATTLRDWVGSLDRDALSFVRQGEEMLLGVYDAVLESWDAGKAPEDRAVVAKQAEEVRSRVAALPAN